MAMENTKSLLKAWRNTSINMGRVADSLDGKDAFQAQKSREQADVYKRFADDLEMALAHDRIFDVEAGD